MTEKQRNWAGNYSYKAARLHHPETVEEIQELARRCSKLKALGSRHSFNAIADTPGDLISLGRLDHIVAVDVERRTVTVEAGVRYGHLGRYLYREGYALPNLASLPHISVAGACATATHGSGDANASLAASVAALELVTANGEVLVLSREQNGEDFLGMVVGLGGLGVVTKLTLELLPSFDMRQDVYEDLRLTELEDNFDAIFSSAYSVSLFTDWQGEHIAQAWLKRRVVDGAPLGPHAAWFGATPAPSDRHPLSGISAVHTTAQMGVPGPWHERMPHFRMDYTPSSGEELQSEYLVPRHHALAALRAIYQVRASLAPLLQISELRTVAADRLWMSPCYEQPCIGIHFTWKKNWRALEKVLPLIEAQLAPFDARPHWGKLFTMSPARVQSLFGKLPDFRDLLRSYDPHGKFRNGFLDAYIFG